MTLLAKLKQKTKAGEPLPKSETTPSLSGIVRRARSFDDPSYHEIPTGFLTRIVDEKDQMPETSRLGRRDYIHVSTLLDVCVRAYALAATFGAPLEPVPRGMRIVWAIGRATEKHVRNALIEALGRSCFYGRWTCTCGARVVSGFVPDGELCETCKQPVNQYKEALLVDEKHKIIGSPDLVLYRRNKFYVIEFKSMAKSKFDHLAEPLPVHVAQAGIYRRIMAAAGMKVSEKVVIFVVNKDFSMGGKKGEHPTYKEFHVDPEQHSAAKVIMDTAFARAEEIREALEKNQIPERTLCHGPDSPHAKKCLLVAQCFSLHSS